MKILHFLLALIVASPVAQAATTTISGLTAITSPSTNTWIEVADMDAATKSRKYLLTNLVTQSTLSTATNSSVLMATNSAKSYADTQLALKANLAGPTFTGDPTAPTPANNDNDTSIATTAWVQNELLSLDDDTVNFDDADNLWTSTKIGSALEELNDSINAGAPNGTGAKVHWSQLLGVPAGFADGTDDGAGGASVPTGTMVNTGASLTTQYAKYSDITGTNLAPDTITLASADFANQGTTTTLLHGNAAGNPSWGAVDLATAQVTGVLPAANVDTALARRIDAPLNLSGTSVDLSLTNEWFSKSLGANTTLTFANPTAGRSFSIILTNGASWTITFPTVTWMSGSAPVLDVGAGKVNIFSFFYDGTTYYGDVSQNSSAILNAIAALANGTGALTNNGSGTFGYYNYSTEISTATNNSYTSATAFANSLTNTVVLMATNSAKAYTDAQIAGVSGGGSTNIVMTSLGTTITPAFSLTNSTAAAAGAQQVSPAFLLGGQGWKTTATAASQPVAMGFYTLPVQGSANPSARLSPVVSINGAAPTASGTYFGSGGEFVAAGSTTIGAPAIMGKRTTPTALTGSVNDYALAISTQTIFRLGSDGAYNITGIAAAGDGTIIFLHNISAFALTLKDEDAASTAANRFALSADYVLGADESAILMYDSVSTRWRIFGQ